MESARSFALVCVATAGFALIGVAGFSQSDDSAQVSDPRAEIKVGDVLKRDQVHIITEPGRYGLGRTVGDSQYAVANGFLIRIDPASMKVLSILRVQNGVLD